jgi:uncharacterized protein with HEPN domain
MWRDDALLLDMLLGARKVREFCRDVSYDAFVADDLRQNATLHVLQLIGEAASKVSKEFHTAHSEIAWAGMIGLRHRLVHDYGRIELAKIWQIVTHEIDPLILALEPLIPHDEP